MPFVLYAIVRAGHRLPEPAPTGLGDPAGPLHLIRYGPLAAAVSATAHVGDLGEAEAVRHFDLLQRLLPGGPVLPLRLGSVAPDSDAVREEVLEPVVDDLPAQLDAINGMVELHLDVDEDEQTSVTAVLEGTPRSDAAGSLPADLDSRVRLGQQVADLVIERRTQQAEQILGQLRPLAEADRPRRHHGGAEDPTLSWAFLVRTDALPAFDDAVATLRRANPYLAVSYVGPLPAVDFIDVPSPAPTEPAGADDHFAGTGRWGWGNGSSAQQPEGGAQ